MENIQATYNEDGSIKAIIDGVEMTVPDNPANRHRQMIAEWENEGNIIQPFVAPPGTPEQNPREEAAILALLKKGLLTEADIAEQLLVRETVVQK